MLGCPIRDRRGQCRNFSDYILGAILKNRLGRDFYLEGGIWDIFGEVVVPTSEAGSPRQTLFGSFDPNKVYSTEGNPLVARFFTWLDFAIRTIRAGKVPRLSRTEYRPQGTMSIAQGRPKRNEPSAGVSPDQI